HPHLQADGGRRGTRSRSRYSHERTICADWRSNSGTLGGLDTKTASFDKTNLGTINPRWEPSWPRLVKRRQSSHFREVLLFPDAGLVKKISPGLRPHQRAFHPSVWRSISCCFAASWPVCWCWVR